MHTAERFFRHRTKLITVHAYVPSDGICRGFAFKYGKFLLPPHFLTALLEPKVPTREQLLSLSHISIKIAFSYSYHDAEQIPFFQYLSYSQRHPSVRLVCFFLIGTILMFHPGPAALSIYKQNPLNAPFYSTLFPLDLLGFRTKNYIL